ncbi:MAG: leucine-rich repeat domain-containing protein [Prevotella sp.]|nr:leucine-rich repeat domain-containing protein [Prevotella sp.]
MKKLLFPIVALLWIGTTTTQATLHQTENVVYESWASNNHQDNSTSSNTWTIELSETGILSFDYSVSSESGYDLLTVTLDNIEIVKQSGEQAGTITKSLDAGSHTLVASYKKDGSGSNGSDEAIIRNIAIGSISDILESYISDLQMAADSNSYLNPATQAEANEYIAEVRSNLAAKAYSTSDYEEVKKQLIHYAERLSYVYLDINITVPGAMGDSILSKVENFADVKSIKLTGKLNDADLTTIKLRLTQLREIDMTDVNMSTLINSFFYQRSLLEIVKLPKELTTIGEDAFYQCTGIKHINFPTSLIAINRRAFYDCNNLQEVILPEGLTTLGEYAFYSCDNNLYVKLPSTLKTISADTFYENVKLKKVDFAEGLTHINNYAFYKCKLENLKFPNTLYYIGGNAFSYNKSLSNIEFNEGLYQIADNAFYDCDALTEITLPSSLVLANESPFDYCDNLVKVTCLSIDPPYMTDQIPLGVSMAGRELYVPALSINTYKQTSGWDKFPTIKPIDYLPETINVRSDLHLTLPDTLPNEYKPVVLMQYLSSDVTYGKLTVNGSGTLSMYGFRMWWSPNNRYNNANRVNYNSLINNSQMRADHVQIQFSTRNGVWAFVSFPFDVKVSNIRTDFYEGTTNWVIRKYDGQKRANHEYSDTWVKMTDDDILNAGEGYIIQSSRYIGTSSQYYSGFTLNAINNENKNNIFINTDATVTLKEYESEFAHNRSWNFIGNPYPCYYDTRFMDFEAPITVWNMNNSTYAAYSPVDDSYILCPGEAFFVQCPVDKNTIIFNKDGRQTNHTARTLPANVKAKRANSVNANRTIVNLNLSDGNHSDRTRIVLNDKASLQYEMDKDASKFMSTEPDVPQIYTSANGVDYAINERPFADGTVNVCASIGTEGTYTIALANDVEGYQVTLEDKAEHKYTLLTDGNEYVFSAKAGTYTDRFVLYFSNKTTGIEEVATNTQDNTDTYSIEGVKVSTPTKKGIYIQNGKKIMLNK